MTVYRGIKGRMLRGKPYHIKIRPPSKRIMRLYRRTAQALWEMQNVRFMGRGATQATARLEAQAQCAEARFLNAISALEDGP